MKPIFIIITPSDMPLVRAALIKEFDSIKYLESDYHVLIFIGRGNDFDFKLLNGTKENYDSLVELKELLYECFQ